MGVVAFLPRRLLFLGMAAAVRMGLNRWTQLGLAVWCLWC